MNERRILEKTEYYTKVEEKYTITKKLCNDCGLYVPVECDDNLAHECNKMTVKPIFDKPVIMFKIGSGTITRNTVIPKDVETYKENGWKFLNEVPEHLQGKCY